MMYSSAGMMMAPQQPMLMAQQPAFMTQAASSGVMLMPQQFYGPQQQLMVPQPTFMYGHAPPQVSFSGGGLAVPTAAAWC